MLPARSTTNRKLENSLVLSRMPDVNMILMVNVDNVVNNLNSCGYQNLRKLQTDCFSGGTTGLGGGGRMTFKMSGRGAPFEVKV